MVVLNDNLRCCHGFASLQWLSGGHVSNGIVCCEGASKKVLVTFSMFILNLCNRSKDEYGSKIMTLFLLLPVNIDTLLFALWLQCNWWPTIMSMPCRGIVQISTEVVRSDIIPSDGFTVVRWVWEIIWRLFLYLLYLHGFKGIGAISIYSILNTISLLNINHELDFDLVMSCCRMLDAEANWNKEICFCMLF